MEENYISLYEDTHWYLSLINKTYGVCINVKDIPYKEKIIKELIESHKIQIDSWKKEWEENVK